MPIIIGVVQLNYNSPNETANKLSYRPVND